MSVEVRSGSARWAAGLEIGPDIDRILAATASEWNDVVTHECYARLTTIEAVRTFMEHHVFAVLDFMWLIKGLQRAVTCVEVPWLPAGDGASRRFVNEIVLAEESDAAGAGWTSHFELYLEAMTIAAADTGPIGAFTDRLADGHDVLAALDGSGAPAAAAAFVRGTSAAVLTGRPHELAAAFALGRENLIPGMFTALLQVGDRFADDLRLLTDYLTRHVELDGDEHTPLAFGLLSRLCGQDDARWREATEAARAALTARRALWDGVVAALEPGTTAG